MISKSGKVLDILTKYDVLQLVASENTNKTDITRSRPCDGLRVDLKRCLLQSDCSLRSKKTPLKCLQTNKAGLSLVDIK